MALLLADENFPMPAVDELRRLGHDVQSLVETEMAGNGVDDTEVLYVARSAGRAVVTLNQRHFVELHETTGGKHAGIVVCSVDPDCRRLAARVDAAVRGVDLVGALVRVRRPTG